ncbi:hypothetical protein BHM03_00033284 [Ensete ventricosum]|nr:hypothetical protein BHM03_00033284 [Ensete ventricosum]
MIVLFSKGYPSPLLAPLCAAATVAPAQAAVLHAVSMGSCPFGRRCCPRAAPYGQAMPPCAGAAPAGDRSCQRPPLQAATLGAGLPFAALQWAAATCSLAAGTAYARKRLPCPRATAPAVGCPYKGVWSWPVAPLQGALAATGCPLQLAKPWVAAPPRCSCCERVE